MNAQKILVIVFAIMAFGAFSGAHARGDQLASETVDWTFIPDNETSSEFSGNELVGNGYVCKISMPGQELVVVTLSEDPSCIQKDFSISLCTVQDTKKCPRSDDPTEGSLYSELGMYNAMTLLRSAQLNNSNVALFRSSYYGGLSNWDGADILHAHKFVVY